MKAVIGIFDNKGNIKTAVTRLKEAGFTEKDLVLITTYQAEEIRDVLGEEPEKAAVSGALVGSGIGGIIGLLGGIALVPIPGIGPVLAFGLMGTVSGSTLGGSLGSIYGTRIEDQPEHELKEALGEQKLILIAHIEEMEEELARDIIQEAGGSYLKTHEVSREAIAEITG
jgi:hypothetical protein